LDFAARADYREDVARIVITAVVAAVIAGIAGYWWSLQYEHELARQREQLTQLDRQLKTVADENLQLHAEITKLQDEETRLAAENNVLNEAIAKARLTGKVPDKLALPYPPK
jgi:uncharacterized protein HemX